MSKYYTNRPNGKRLNDGRVTVLQHTVCTGKTKRIVLHKPSNWDGTDSNNTSNLIPVHRIECVERCCICVLKIGQMPVDHAANENFFKFSKPPFGWIFIEGRYRLNREIRLNLLHALFIYVSWASQGDLRSNRWLNVQSERKSASTNSISDLSVLISSKPAWIWICSSYTMKWKTK